MSIHKNIKDALEGIGLKVYFVTRGSNKPPCITYNYINNPKLYNDNEEQAEEYTILVNVIVQDNIEKTKKQVKENMLAAGFTGGNIQTTLQEQGGFFNTPIKFKKIIFKK